MAVWWNAQRSQSETRPRTESMQISPFRSVRGAMMRRFELERLAALQHAPARPFLARK